MSTSALLLILSAAILHAAWNYLVKRIKGGVLFTWLFSVLSSGLFALPALIVLRASQISLSGLEWLFIFGSGGLHVAYFLTLQTGYRKGDLSLVYPLARGTAPLLTTIGAVLLFNERPGWLAVTGILLVVSSVFILTGGLPSRSRTTAHGSNEAFLYGFLTAFWIAAYSLWDKYAVGFLLINPLLFSWLSDVARSVILLPPALARRRELGGLWRQHGLMTLLVAFLSSLAYILVLTAMSFTDVSYVAPSREISILFGTFLGAHILGEGHTKQRLFAAAGMVVGVACLALG